MKGVSGMEILINPNIAYILLVSGTILLILAILAPGTGVLELGALFVLLLAGWEIYNLPFNPWALVIWAVGVIPFIIAVRQSKKLIYLIIAIASMIIGSIFLFQGETPWSPAVSPLLAVVVSILSGVFLWIVATKALEAEKRKPVHDAAKLIGMLGEAKSEIENEGSVQVNGELWSARSENHIQTGARIRVINREGFVLVVEQID
jgi:membrane-bound ClpP family serine protease